MKNYSLTLFITFILLSTFSISCGIKDGPSLMDTDTPPSSAVTADWLPHSDHLIGYWKMNNNWDDYSGRNNHGSAAGGVPGFTTTSKVGSHAGDFNGSSYVSVPHSPSIDVTNGFTVMCWLYVPAPVGANFWLFSKNPPGFTTGFGIAFDHNTAQIWPHLGISGVLRHPKSNGSIIYGQWNYIVITFDNSDITIYLNGVFDSSLSVVGAIGTNASPFYISNSPGSPGEYLTGHIDNLALWDVALTPSEISDIYNRQF